MPNPNTPRSALRIGGTLPIAFLLLAPQAAPAASPALKPLYSFRGGADGGVPDTPLVMGSGGVIYGATNEGGTGSCTSGCGTVFSLSPPSSAGGAWTETVLHRFAGGTGDGALPDGVAIGPGGVLYGTTGYGGTGSCTGAYAGCGTVFSLTPPDAPGAAWTESVLYNFAGGSDGVLPRAGVLIGPTGILYGTTQYGGSGPCFVAFAGCGTVFSLTPPAVSGEAWTENVLYEFAGGPSDGAEPLSGVVFGGPGVLYGTTSNGGLNNYNGTVYSLTAPSGSGAWTETVLHYFTGGDGATPWAGVVAGAGGILYGTTYNGGPGDNGTVFSLTPPGSPGGTWTEAVLYGFTGGTDGAFPIGGVAIGDEGALYGTTDIGGTSQGYGTVYGLKPPASPDGPWTKAELHMFTGGRDGRYPQAGVLIGPGGMLYGTATSNGAANHGTVFSLRP
jgi:uncharacterized repeat protein (TIGR03803 family)